MTSTSPSVLRRAFAAALALILALGVAAWAPTARAQEAGGSATAVTGAELRWGVNAESSTRGHAPGSFNFLYAGDVSPHITGPNTTLPASAWSSKAGNVTIQKRSASGALATAAWADTQTDRSGAALKNGSHSGLEMVFGAGRGTVDAEAGTAKISWKGASSVVYYSGFVYMTISDPELVVTASSATITAELGGHKTDRENSSVWDKLTPRRVTIADLPRNCVELGGDKGFAVSPEYLGIKYSDPTGAAPQKQTGDTWGSFPSEFVDFANDTGSGQFWYSSGGSADAMKVALPVSVGWASGDSGALKEVCDSPTSGGGGGSGVGGSKGVLGQVVDDTVEDILRAAGTDVADTAAAWMDEAWKPAQPGAVKAAQAGGAPAADGAGDAGAVVVDEEFTAQYDEQYSSTTPMTAGTVGAVVASTPSPGGGSSGGSSGNAGVAPASVAPASAVVADQATMPVAANLPLTDVVYSSTSASSDAGNAFPQWQWWVGGVLLALAAGLFYQVFLRKD